MSQASVSVIIPAYQAERHIGQALASIQQQTFVNWEVVIVEDGTQDGTQAIVNSFAQQVGSDKVHYIRHELNQGLSATRNTGISHAKGKYIALLDHDDYWQPFHLEQAVQALESGAADLVYSTASLFEDGTGRFLRFLEPDQEELENFPASLLIRNFIPVSSVVMSRKIPETIGGFDTSLRRVEDLDYWLRSLDANFHFRYLAKFSCFYRQNNPTAMTANKSAILEWHAIVLQKHCHLKVVPRRLRDRAIARYSFGVARRCWNCDFWKAFQFLIRPWMLNPVGALLAIYWFLKEPERS